MLCISQAMETNTFVDYSYCDPWDAHFQYEPLVRRTEHKWCSEQAYFREFQNALLLVQMSYYDDEFYRVPKWYLWASPTRHFCFSNVAWSDIFVRLGSSSIRL
jgi:hypothetical protein